ncbi:hypothetical protein KNU48_gp047 [Mycobacterium phage Silverleaf]|uniref:Uncharacterized protein n=1 Tax=Mycobacterium phage Silverleaf TaxID=2517969 RepID=A0A482JBX7_9CAUD|nr:hypothetical protein KNU48_gp047 [Mycobacterium phage Silverleaf]QBP29196.1 hypothetical protein SEA_SILVERLEAF_123 [Mycobacterium phage Silverleaf]
MKRTPKWVSPTGYTVMYEDEAGNVTYEFPSEPHPQLPYTDTSNKGAYGLKARTSAALAKEGNAA